MIGDPARAKGLVRFLTQSLRLKSTPRTGWLDRGIPPAETESVADHAYQTALLAWLAAAGDPTLDRDRILKLALIHDLPEAITGDKTPYDRDKVPDSAPTGLPGAHISIAAMSEAPKASRQSDNQKPMP